jgi:hypothetical protein
MGYSMEYPTRSQKINYCLKNIQKALYSKNKKSTLAQQLNTSRIYAKHYHSKTISLLPLDKVLKSKEN